MRKVFILLIIPFVLMELVTSEPVLVTGGTGFLAAHLIQQVRWCLWLVEIVISSFSVIVFEKSIYHIIYYVNDFIVHGDGSLFVVLFC